jgi:translation elongation factor EF-1beta
MKEVYYVLKTMHMKWKVIGQFGLKCKYSHTKVPHKDVILILQLYKLPEGGYLLDLSRTGGCYFLSAEPFFNSIIMSAANLILYWAATLGISYPEISHATGKPQQQDHKEQPQHEKHAPKEEVKKVEEAPKKTEQPPKQVEQEAPKQAEEEEDMGDDLFAEQTEEEKEAERKRQEEVGATKKAPVGKSNIILDVKTWDDQADFEELERLVRGIQIEGATWGPSKLVPVAYNIKKLQISVVVIDELVSSEDLEERIMALGDELVQSVDIAAFVKV